MAGHGKMVMRSKTWRKGGGMESERLWIQGWWCTPNIHQYRSRKILCGIKVYKGVKGIGAWSYWIYAGPLHALKCYKPVVGMSLILVLAPSQGKPRLNQYWEKASWKPVGASSKHWAAEQWVEVGMGILGWGGAVGMGLIHEGWRWWQSFPRDPDTLPQKTWFGSPPFCAYSVLSANLRRPIGASGVFHCFSNLSGCSGCHFSTAAVNGRKHLMGFLNSFFTSWSASITQCITESTTAYGDVF